MIPKTLKKLILLCFLGILIIAGVLSVIVKNKYQKANPSPTTTPKDFVSEKKETMDDTPPSTYPEDFASGKQVIWFDNKGIYKYEGDLEKPKVIISFAISNHGSDPILSPDNKKILYCISQNCVNQDIEKNLWVYDISKDLHIKLLPERKIIPNSYAWAEDSQSVIYTLRKNEGDQLYRVALNGAITPLGTNYSGNAYWPKPIGERYIAFTREQYCDDRFIDDGPKSYPCHTGILDLQTNEVFMQNALGDDNKIIKKIDQNTVIRIAKDWGKLGNVKKDANKLILGLEKISLTNKKIETVPLPTTFVQDDNLRIMIAYSHKYELCGNNVILAQLSDQEMHNNSNYISADYRYFVYNIKNNSLKEIDNKFTQRQYTYLSCGVNYKNDKVYSRIYISPPQIENDLSIMETNLSNPHEIKELNYSSLLFSPEIVDQYKKGCLYVYNLDLDSANGSDFAYYKVGSNMYTEGGMPGCDANAVSSLMGIYRLSISEKTITKIAKDGDFASVFEILTPNL